VKVIDYEAFFFKQRWPDGFECPNCGCGHYYIISTRRLPLYQCRFCKHQTTVTAGTVMDRSRTPLSKWTEAIEVLSATYGVNAVQLSSLIHVTHKTAWIMLRKIRRAISAYEGPRLLSGAVHAGLRHLGRRNLQPFVPHPQEHAVLITASVDHNTGEPTRIKLSMVPPRFLDGKQLTRHGSEVLLRKNAHPNAKAKLLRRVDLHMFNPIYVCFQQAATRIYGLFHGLGRKYLQYYLDEYSFRWNIASMRLSPREQWLKLCLKPAPQTLAI